jgi:hypothetical protein
LGLTEPEGPSFISRLTGYGRDTRPIPDMSSGQPTPPLHFGSSGSTSGLSWRYLGFEISGPAGLLWKRFPTPIGSNHLVERECTSVCGPLIPKIQFNGIGGLLTYITLIPNADVFA